MVTTSAVALLEAVGLPPLGPVKWGVRVPCHQPGVYVIETPTAHQQAPLDGTVITSWLRLVPTLQVDGHRPSAQALRERLASFWIADESVVYIGLAGTSVGVRLSQFSPNATWGAPTACRWALAQDAQRPRRPAGVVGDDR